MQRFRLSIFLFACSCICIVLGFIVSGLFGALVGFLFSIIVHITLITLSPFLCLSFAHAERAKNEKDGEFITSVHKIAALFEVPSPQIYVSPDPQPNICIVGIRKGITYLIATQGLLELVPQDEQEAFISFAIARSLKNNLADHTIMAAYTGIITEISQMGQFSILSQHQTNNKVGNSISALLFFILAPIASFFIKFVISRNFALQADFLAASTTRAPLALANMIEKADNAVSNNIPLINPNPSLAFLYAVHPIKHSALTVLFSLHSPADIRIQKLRGMIL